MKKLMYDPYKRKGVILLGLPLVVLTLSLLPDLTEGLKCYECLSLSCDSGAICESIKEIMVKIFVPKSHFIHFDPREKCPETEYLHGNSTLWANLSHECHRSDSFCLVAPIEVVTTFDGTKSNTALNRTKSQLKLEDGSTMSSVGYLRGCASRRKLLEKDDTIKVVATLTDDLVAAGANATNPDSRTNKGNGKMKESNATVSHDNHRHQQSQQNSGMNDVVFHSSGNTGKTGRQEHNQNHLLNNSSFDDDYIITKIYSHVFYIDQGTSNATRCYSDNCNNPKRSGAISVNSSGMSSIVYALVVTRYILYELGRYTS